MNEATRIVRRPGEPEVPERPHPVVASIVSDLGMHDGELCIREERFEYWVRRLWTRHRSADNEPIFYQLGVLSFRLAKHRCVGAMQLYALATLFVPGGSVEYASQNDPFFSTSKARKTRDSARAIAATGVTAALPQPELASGVRTSPLRRTAEQTREKK